MHTLHFESDDLERAEEFLSRAYARMSIGSDSPDVGRVTITRTTMPSVSVDELDLGFEMSYSVSPLGKICLCLVHDGTIRDHAYSGVEDAFGPGDVVSFAPPDRPYSGRICNARYNITMLDTGLLTQVASTAPGRSPEPVRLTGHRPHSPAAARRLRESIGYVRDHVLADPELAKLPLIASTAAQHLVASVLAAFPNTALDEPTATDRNDSHSATLRLALAYIEDHAAEPITVADIAAAAHVSVRALQYAFRRHLDTTPLAHLRRVRLSHAHQDLLAADPLTTTVTDVAARWGFFHAGRFAAVYRDAYGRPPLQTLGTG
ncbi:helix-turn-helix transcriptional regulator [Streptomyces griseus]|uniref:helix-turn-helix transcriptional regulator n=1 Tax=Streptomyces griseus TaxID=1911 RepID=UPI0005644B92|nr:helix-turn-helix transcriptional regulator [Streptomyces griseus]